MEAAAALCLKPKKCNIVPVWCELSEGVVQLIKRFLELNIAQWCHFNVLPMAKYLGFMLGPAASLASFAEPIAKWNDR
eukprot:3788182-Alexandrium_andersonii.AAC.1